MISTCSPGRRCGRGVVAAALALVLSVPVADARQFRGFNPIRSPHSAAAAQQDAVRTAASALPAGAVEAVELTPLPRALVEPLVRRVVDRWNTPAMAETLAEQFFDRTRVLDAVDRVAPRDAKLRFQAVRGVQTLQQYIVPGAAGERGSMVSVVSATVQTQLEFNDATNGFVRRTGTNELILKVTSPAPP